MTMNKFGSSLFTLHLPLALLLALGTVSASQAGAEDTFDLSTPHFGAEIMMMPGGPLSGSMITSLVYESTSFEAALGYNFYESRGSGDVNSTNGTNAQSTLEVRLGKRYEIGRLSYANVGVDYAPTWGKQNGVSVSENYTVGPYIGFSRQFPNSNVLFTAFVIPYEYLYSKTSNGPTIANAFFIDGGIGIDYLF